MVEFTPDELIEKFMPESWKNGIFKYAVRSPSRIQIVNLHLKCVEEMKQITHLPIELEDIYPIEGVNCESYSCIWDKQFADNLRSNKNG